MRIFPLSLVLILLTSSRLFSLSSFNIGRIADRPTKQIEEYTPFVNHVVTSLSKKGIKSGRVVVSKSVKEMHLKLKRKEVDFLLESVFVTFKLQESGVSAPFLRAWKKGKPDYCSVLFCLTESPIGTVYDLKGKKIGFEDPGSTTAYLAPKALLLRSGLTLVDINRNPDLQLKERIGYFFFHDEDNILIQVFKKNVAAGAYDNIEFESIPSNLRKKFKIIKKSEPFPRFILSARQGISKKSLALVREFLLNLHLSLTGKEVLKVTKIARFDPIPNNGLTEAEKLYMIIKNEI